MVRVLYLVALLGCQSGSKQRPPAVTDDMVGAMDRDIAVVRKVAAELDLARGNCKQAAEVIRDNTAAVAAAAKNSRRYKQLSKDDAAVRAWIDATYRTTENLAAEATLKRVSKQCESDPSYQAAMALQQAANSGS
jgi:hypothetical protein